MSNNNVTKTKLNDATKVFSDVLVSERELKYITRNK